MYLYLSQSALFLILMWRPPWPQLFFFNDTATTEIYTLSLHDALPISLSLRTRSNAPSAKSSTSRREGSSRPDRKSTLLNSSHGYISYAVFCLKKKKTKKHNRLTKTYTKKVTQQCVGLAAHVSQLHTSN